MSPAISTIPTTTTSNSVRPWTRSRTIVRATATPRGRRGRECGIMSARTSSIAVGKPPVEGETSLAVRDAHDVTLLEQGKPALLDAEGSTYELLAQGAALAPQSPALSFF